jgi:hypothetical protein
MEKDERHYHNLTLLMHVPGDVTTEGVRAKLIVPPERGRAGWHGHEDMPGEVRPTCFIPAVDVLVRESLLGGTDLPALIAVNSYQTDPRDPILVKGDVVRIASLADLDAVEAWMPGRIDERISGLGRNVGGIAEIEYEISRAHARTEKDEILVVMVDAADGSGPGGHVLSKTGIRLHDVHELSDHLWSFGLGQGIWIGTDVCWSDGGEDGWEWDARWSKATESDLERHGIGIDEVADHASDMAERPIGTVEAAGWLVEPAAVED